MPNQMSGPFRGEAGRFGRIIRKVSPYAIGFDSMRLLAVRMVLTYPVLSGGMDEAARVHRWNWRRGGIIRVFNEELAKLGWTVGRNVRLDYRWGANDADLDLQPGLRCVNCRRDNAGRRARCQ